MLNLNSYMGVNPIQRNIMGMFNTLDTNSLPFANPNMMSLYNSNPSLYAAQATSMFNAAGFTKGVDWSNYNAKATQAPWYKNTQTVAGLTAGAASFISGSAQNYAMGQVYGAAADTYRTQAKLALDNIETQNAYLNEQGSQQIWNLADQKSQFKSEQMMAWAGSGFTDISTGDRRIIADTDKKFTEATSGIQRSMFLQNFENWRSGMMEYSRLQYAAKSAERMSKASNSVFSYLGTLGNAAMSGLGAYWSLGGGQSNNFGKNINPKGKTA